MNSKRAAKEAAEKAAYQEKLTSRLTNLAAGSANPRFQQALQRALKTTAAAGPPKPDSPLKSTTDSCSACNGLGYIFTSEFAPGKPAPKPVHCPACAGEQYRERLVQQSGLLSEELSLTLSDYGVSGWGNGDADLFNGQREKSRAAISAALRNPQGFYTWFGDFGGGKTMALQIIVAESVRDGRQAHYTILIDLLDELRRMVARRVDSTPLWDRLLDIPVLAIDEVTRFNETGWAQEKLFQLVDQRYRRKQKLTIFALNEQPDQLDPYEGLGYLFSRMQKGVMVELRGDYRLIRQKKGVAV